MTSDSAYYGETALALQGDGAAGGEEGQQYDGAMVEAGAEYAASSGDWTRYYDADYGCDYYHNFRQASGLVEKALASPSDRITNWRPGGEIASIAAEVYTRRERERGGGREREREREASRPPPRAPSMSAEGQTKKNSCTKRAILLANFNLGVNP